MTKKKETCKCAVCGEEYDPKEVKRIYGDVLWKHSFCSARCYTNNFFR